MIEREELSINEALQYLKEGEILVSLTNDAAFKLVENKVNIYGKNYKASLEIKEFVQTYKDLSFYLYVDAQESVSLEKDKEYYSWIRSNKG